MGDMTKNFSRAEFACKCGCGTNVISRIVVEYCQIIRDAAGKPLTISCGTRCVKHNAELKNSVPNSSHLTGLAADIYVEGISQRALGEVIKKLHKAGKLPKLKYCYLIKDGGRAVHFDIDSSKRKQRWRKFAF